MNLEELNRLSPEPSLIIWHKVEDLEPPDSDYILVAYIDDTGDYYRYCVEQGWYIRKYKVFIVDNEVNSNVRYWAYLPGYPRS